MSHPHDSLCDRTVDLLALADAHRWTVVKTLRSQSVAEHSYQVAVIAWELAERLDVPIECYPHILTWALAHDAPETFTGDIDGRAKREFPNLKEVVTRVENIKFPWHWEMSMAVSPMVRALVKVADTIEAMTFIKVWGHGERADDVYWELCNKLFKVDVVALNAVMDRDVRDAVSFITEQSTHERNSVQFRDRRDRVKAVATET